MESATSFIFFALLIVVMVGMYLAIRRQWASPAIISGGGVIASIIAMALFSLAQGNLPLQAIIVGLVVGSILSMATLAVAWYFQGNEMREQYMKKQMAQPLEETYET